MSWLFSQALVEEYSVGTSLAGQPCAQLSVMPTLHKFWRSDKTIDAFDHSRFGLTSQVLTGDHGAELLTSYLVASRARTSAEQEKAPESTEHEADSGPKCAVSFAKYDRVGSMWKTAQCSLFEDSGEFLETWPRWGSMRSGVSYLRAIPALPICASESGLWPTPTASLGTNGGRVTPRKGREGGTLIEAIAARTWPTPTTMNFTGGAALCKWGGAGARKKLATMVTPAEMNGQLNPQWVEWLMGWPIGWTCLKPLEMARFHEWQQQHGAS